MERFGCASYNKGGRRGLAIDTGTRVRIKPDVSIRSRPHLMLHARHGDVGVLGTQSKQSPAMSDLYVIVHFDICGRDHRLLESEIEPA